MTYRVKYKNALVFKKQLQKCYNDLEYALEDVIL